MTIINKKPWKNSIINKKPWTVFVQILTFFLLLLKRILLKANKHATQRYQPRYKNRVITNHNYKIETSTSTSTTKTQQQDRVITHYKQNPNESQN